MFKILLNDSFFDYEIKIEVITYLIENDNDYSYKCLSNEFTFKFNEYCFLYYFTISIKRSK